MRYSATSSGPISFSLRFARVLDVLERVNSECCTKAMFWATHVQNLISPTAQLARHRNSCSVGNYFLVADSHFALSERSTMRRLHLSRRVLVCLPGGFPNRLTVEGELVPVDSTSLVDCHLTLPFLKSSADSIHACTFDATVYIHRFLRTAYAYISASRISYCCVLRKTISGRCISEPDPEDARS